MKIDTQEIKRQNDLVDEQHHADFKYIAEKLHTGGFDVDVLLKKIQDFQIAIPSWALGAGGTRFGRFPGDGAPENLEGKIEDVGILHALNASSGAVSLHIPWDIPKDVQKIQDLARENNLLFDAVNSNTFQDQEGQEQSYKFGSLSHTDKSVRQQAIEHNKEVIEYGKSLGSKSLTVWLSDGSCFPGQTNFREAFQRTLDSLQEIYQHLPADWKMFIEYKPYEPNFYSTVIQDWGSSYMLASKLGNKAYCLVDLGHHLPNTNIEQIVATLMMEGKLGGFHFNDSKYGDDDLTVGSIKPYQLFLIFIELLDGMINTQNPYPAWMIDASHNVKDPLEDLLQSVEAIKIAYAQALLLKKEELIIARQINDATNAQEILQHAFRTDVRPLLAEARRRAGASIAPLATYRNLNIRKQLIQKRGFKTISSGL